MSKVLVLEDEEDIRAFIKINLKRAGYEVIEAETGEEALEKAEEFPDLDIAVLDVMLPGISGLEVCKQLREKSKSIGILMLTAKSQELDKISGLTMGADDYMIKPFSPAEFVARVDSIARRVDLVKREDSNIVISGPFKIDTLARSIYKGNEEIDLTQIEYAILSLLIEKEQQSLTREDILNSVWGENYFGDPKIVDVNIRRLRKKIEEDPSKPKYIKTIWGYGYRWRKEN